MVMPHENYGIDAPGVVRTLFIAGGALIISGLVGFGMVRNGYGSDAILFIRNNGFAVGGCLLLAGGWMLVSSIWLKQALLQRLLSERQWNGDEVVLDIGCGRGLVAIGAAKRLSKQGSVIGVDLWQKSDLAGNNSEAAAANAKMAGVADKVTFETGDARFLPYPSATFDVVASMTAIHNIPDRAGRRKAIEEAWRVTKPKGQLLIFDILHARAYAAQFRQLGGTVRMSRPLFLWGMIGWRLIATKD